MLLIENAELYTPRRMGRGAMLTDGARVAALGTRLRAPSGCERIDARGMLLVPGFVELHTHGCYGHDFMDASPEANAAMARAYLRHGVTSLTPTTIAAGWPETLRALDALRETTPPPDGAQFLGAHLEGPYFAHAQSGAQPPEHLIAPDPAQYLPLLETRAGEIARWSAAPELQGAADFARACAAHGVLVAFAHTDAAAPLIIEARAWGFSHFTHLYSGMNAVHRIRGWRHAGAVEAAYLMEDATVELICDGIHLPGELLRHAYRVKGPDAIALVTDSMRAAGLPEGEYALGADSASPKVIVREGVAWMPDFTCFAGSVATGERLLRVAMAHMDCPLEHALRMLTQTPARILGARGKGALRIGMDADALLLDETYTVRMVIRAGEVVYRAR